MAIPLALMSIGAATQVVGGWVSNMDQAAQELRNEKYYQKQAEYVRLAEARAQQIAEFDYGTKIGTQISAYAGGGAELSGSAVNTVGATIANYINETFAIKKKGDLDFELANSRGLASGEKADRLGSLGYNALQAGGSLINSYTSTKGFGTMKSGGES